MSLEDETRREFFEQHLQDARLQAMGSDELFELIVHNWETVYPAIVLARTHLVVWDLVDKRAHAIVEERWSLVKEREVEGALEALRQRTLYGGSL